jgi:hypothetical protein
MIAIRSYLSSFGNDSCANFFPFQFSLSSMAREELMLFTYFNSLLAFEPKNETLFPSLSWTQLWMDTHGMHESFTRSLLLFRWNDSRCVYERGKEKIYFMTSLYSFLQTRGIRPAARLCIHRREQ